MLPMCWRTAESICRTLATFTGLPDTHAQLLAEVLGGVQITGPDRRAEAIGAVVHQADRLLVVGDQGAGPVALGGDPATMAGLAGLGDLVATCASPLSRNRTAGRHIGTGMSAEEAVAAMSQTAEGIKSVSAVVHVARAHGVEMPISELMDRVIAGDVAVDRLAELLLARDLKSEGRTA